MIATKPQQEVIIRNHSIT